MARDFLKIGDMRQQEEELEQKRRSDEVDQMPRVDPRDIIKMMGDLYAKQEEERMKDVRSPGFVQDPSVVPLDKPSYSDLEKQQYAQDDLNYFQNDPALKQAGEQAKEFTVENDRFKNLKANPHKGYTQEDIDLLRSKGDKTPAYTKNNETGLYGLPPIPEENTVKSQMDKAMLSKAPILDELLAGNRELESRIASNRLLEKNKLQNRIVPEPSPAVPAKPGLDEEIVGNESESESRDVANLKPMIDFTGDNLSNAQEDQNTAVFGNELLKSLSFIGAGISGADPTPGLKLFDSNIETSKGIFKNRSIQDKNDPDSGYSKGLAKYASQFGVDVKGASAAQIESVMPMIYKSYEAQEAREAKTADLKMRLIESKAKAEAETNQRSIDKKETNAINKKEKDANFIERASKQVIKHSETKRKLDQANTLIEDAVKAPNAVKDVSSLYSLITALDPSSTVREGEVALARQANGLFGNVLVKLSQLTADPQLINKETLNDIKNTISSLKKISDNEYRVRTDLFLRQAKSRGISKEQFDEIDIYSQSEQPLEKTKDVQAAPIKENQAKKPLALNKPKEPLSQSDINEEERRTVNNKIAIFNKKTKKFIRWE